MPPPFYTSTDLLGCVNIDSDVTAGVGSRGTSEHRDEHHCSQDAFLQLSAAKHQQNLNL